MKVLLLIMATIAYVVAEEEPPAIEWDHGVGICLIGSFKDGCKRCECASDGRHYSCSKECVDESQLVNLRSEVFHDGCKKYEKFKKDCKTCFCDGDEKRYVCTMGCDDD